MTRRGRVPRKISEDPGVGEHGKKWKEGMEDHFEDTGDLYEEIRHRKKKGLTDQVR